MDLKKWALADKARAHFCGPARQPIPPGHQKNPTIIDFTVTISTT